jgi:hypothetical protein
VAQQQQVTLPWNQSAITALAAAIAQGARTVTFEGKSVTYASIAEMNGLLDRMTRYVASQGDGVPPVNVRGSVFVRR